MKKIRRMALGDDLAITGRIKKDMMPQPIQICRASPESMPLPDYHSRSAEQSWCSSFLMAGRS